MRPVTWILLLATTLVAQGDVRVAESGWGPGRAATWVWHFDPYVAELMAPAYRDLIDALPADSRIVVCVQSPRDAHRFTSIVGAGDDRRIEFAVTRAGLSVWARDRYVLYSKGGLPFALVPDEASVRQIWRGDLEVPSRLSKRFPRLRVLKTRLAIEGGNVLVTDDRVIVGDSILTDSRKRFDGRDEEVVQELERAFGRRAIIIGGPELTPPHVHVDMYLSVVDHRTVLLGDPSLTSEYFDRRASLGIDDGDVRGVGFFSKKTQIELAATYDRIATQLVDEGFRVERLPILHSDNADEVITWNNAVVERRNGQPRAYVPCYGIPLLDEKAFACWRRLGVEVVPIRSDGAILEGGAVRCLSNIVYEE